MTFMIILLTGILERKKPVDFGGSIDIQRIEIKPLQ